MDNNQDPNVGGGGPVSNPGNTGGWQTILFYQLNVSRGCRIQALANYKMSYNQANIGWATQLTIDGVVVQESWGGAPLDAVTLLGSLNVGAGYHEIKVLWQAGTSNIQAIRPKLSLSWTYK